MILALTFASLMLARLANLTELGFGVAVGIVIAAFAMAPVLVPALSAVEGHLFWWPRHARPDPVAQPETEPEAAGELPGRPRARSPREAGRPWMVLARGGWDCPGGRPVTCSHPRGCCSLSGMAEVTVRGCGAGPIVCGELLVLRGGEPGSDRFAGGVLVGDPGRAFLRTDGLSRVATFEIPVTVALEGMTVKRAAVHEMTAGS